MSHFDTGHAVLLIVAALSLAGVVYTSRQTRLVAAAATEVARRTATDDAYTRARAIDSQTITRLDRDLQAAQRILEQLRADLSAEQLENFRLHEHVDRLEATVVRLRTRLAMAGLLDDRGTAPDGSDAERD